jgi:hypothetical protein
MPARHRATTRHVQSAYPFVGSDASPEGVVIGADAQTSEVFAYDPWLMSDRGVIAGPNMVVFGSVGYGKSSLVKTYLLRSLVFGVRSRVLDPKGEYARVARVVDGAQVVQVGLDGEVKINPLDPAIGPAQQAALIEALVEATAAARLEVIGRVVLATTLAHVRATQTHPTLGDLRDALWSPPAEVVGRCGGDRSRVADAAAPSAAALDLVLGGELAGLVSGESSVSLDPNCPLLVADVSRIVPLGGTAVAAAMAVVGTWLQAMLATRSGRQIIVLDECWRLLRDASTARWLQSSTKLAREWQASLITVFHRLSDLVAVGDEGTEQVQIARGLISDAETRVIYRQTAGDVAALGELLGLSGQEQYLVPRLGRAVSLWRVGGRSTVVRHTLSSLEADLIETEAHRRAEHPPDHDPDPGDDDDLDGLVGAALGY